MSGWDSSSWKSVSAKTLCSQGPGGIHLPLAARHGGDVDESTSVCEPLLGATFRGLLLLLGFDLYCRCQQIFLSPPPRDSYRLV